MTLLDRPLRFVIAALFLSASACAPSDIQNTMANELDALAVPPNVQRLGADGHITNAGALRERVFQYQGPFGAVVAFYDAELPRHGWLPAHQSSPTSPTFCKQALRLDVSTVQGSSSTQFLLLITTNATDSAHLCP